VDIITVLQSTDSFILVRALPRQAFDDQLQTIFQVVPLAWLAISSHATEVQIKIEMKGSTIVEVKQNDEEGSKKTAVEDEACVQRIR
jgi:hypothetical protein